MTDFLFYVLVFLFIHVYNVLVIEQLCFTPINNYYFCFDVYINAKVAVIHVVACINEMKTHGNAMIILLYMYMYPGTANGTPCLVLAADISALVFNPHE